VRRVEGEHLVRCQRWGLDLVDELGFRRAIGPPRIVLAEGRPPVGFRPLLERARVGRGQSVTRNAVVVGDDRGQVGLSDHVRADEHVAQQLRVAE
jgi:hypothetical protein